MPSRDQVRVLKPKDWQELQRITASLLAAVYPDSNVQEYGRTGQKQYGVDITVQGKQSSTATSSGTIAVQCKIKLSADAVVKEYRKAERFPQPIDEFIVFTASDRDTSLQDTAMKLTQGGPIPCTVNAWEDIEGLLAQHSAVFDHHYKGFLVTSEPGSSARNRMVTVNFPEGCVTLYLASLKGLHSHFDNCFLIGDMFNRRCISATLPIYPTRLKEMYGRMNYECYFICKWLNTFASMNELLDDQKPEESFAVSAEDFLSFLKYLKGDEDE